MSRRRRSRPSKSPRRPANRRRPSPARHRRLWGEWLEPRTLLAVACSPIVTNTNDTGSGSLREAINCANTDSVLDTISFNIPGTGVKTISPASSLPIITSPVVIDGYTQTGASANTNAIDDPDPAKRGFNGTLQIELTGSGIVLEGLTLA